MSPQAFYSPILFYPVLFHSTQSFFILYYPMLSHSILSCPILSYISSYSIPSSALLSSPNHILSHSILSYPILPNPILYYPRLAYDIITALQKNLNLVELLSLAVSIIGFCLNCFTQTVNDNTEHSVIINCSFMLDLIFLYVLLPDTKKNPSL